MPAKEILQQSFVRLGLQSVLHTCLIIGISRSYNAASDLERVRIEINWLQKFRLTTQLFLIRGQNSGDLTTGSFASIQCIIRQFELNYTVIIHAHY